MVKLGAVIVVAALACALLVLTLAGQALGAPASGGDASDSCRLSAREAKDCSLCCALGGFNKFDSQQFQSGKGCKCYKDEKELGTNSRHKQRRP